MDIKKIEKKWKDNWKRYKNFQFNKKNLDNKYYILEMFSYPSGSNLHLGHWFNFALSDSFARYKKMLGKNVFEPMGFDAFGLPAENYAIKTGIHPKDSTIKNIEIMRKQLEDMGAMFDFSHEIITCNKEYYKWTQLLFLLLYKNNLAYQKEGAVNWCDDCKTVIANEQVQNGKCERCGNTIERKNMKQWYFAITKYAEKLLTGLDNLDWPEKTKAMQKNWIGKSKGFEIDFLTTDNTKIKIFTTRLETIFGATFIALAPEHPLIATLTAKKYSQAVETFLKKTKSESDIDRSKDFEGIFIGAYALHPITKKKLPIYIAKYCLSGYGTGAIMGVPAHDERDKEFAKQNKIAIIQVIKHEQKNKETLINSENYSGQELSIAKKAISEYLTKNNLGIEKTHYRFRDWSVSRQRYWGTPIPIIYCKKCGTVPVKEEDLPIELPYDVCFSPDGCSPLSKSTHFLKTKCPICNGDAERESDTLDTFVCSSWYYLRYPDNNNQTEPFSKTLINKMLPVDKYIGGAEHACMHLLYARFITKVLHDLKMLDFDEPFLSLVHQGMILGKDGNKMSKSKGNVINPDDYVKMYSSDTLRLYLMFGFSYFEGGAFSEDQIQAMHKFLLRLIKIVENYYTACNTIKENEINQKDVQTLEYVLNFAIKSVRQDLENFSFNTAIARIMELVNAMYKYENTISKATKQECMQQLVLLIAPLVPHIAEELYHMITHKKDEESVFFEKYPMYDPQKLKQQTIEYAVQINNKIKMRLNIDSTFNNEEIEKLVLDNKEVQKLLNNKTVQKIIIVKNRLINIIISG